MGEGERSLLCCARITSPPPSFVPLRSEPSPPALRPPLSLRCAPEGGGVSIPGVVLA